MSRMADRLGLPREYDRVRDDGCAGCGAPRMRGQMYCVDCATADEITGIEAAALLPPAGEVSGHWHLERTDEVDGMVFEVYRGPTFGAVVESAR